MARLTVTPDPAHIGDRIVIEGAGFGAASLLQIDQAGDDNGLIFTAVDGGAQGDDISISLVDPATPDTPLSVEVTSLAIEVSLETTGNALSSTANDVMQAVNNDPDASALVHVTPVSGSDGTGLMAATVAPGNLAQGADAAYAELELIHSGEGTEVLRHKFPVSDGAFSSVEGTQPGVGFEFELEREGTLVIKGYIPSLSGPDELVAEHHLEVFSA